MLSLVQKFWIYTSFVILSGVFLCHVSYHQRIRPGDVQDLGLIIPLQGYQSIDIVSPFGDPRQHGRRLHNGIDIAAPGGTPVVAPQDGIIVHKAHGRNAGNYLWLLDYRGEYLYEFLHLRGFADGIQKNKEVRQGEVIGYVGNTGNARNGSPHLHFSIAKLYVKGKVDQHKRYLDPDLFLPK
jgi:murein DD-endopeptidase MepM/ murein hydrolase activator NlpD